MCKSKEQRGRTEKVLPGFSSNRAGQVGGAIVADEIVAWGIVWWLSNRDPLAEKTDHSDLGTAR